jgi:CheY-like chemotaxis protein
MILLVDDDPDFLQKAEAIMARHRQVYFARDAKSALDLMASVGEGFTVALIDLDLPGVDGFELIGKMRRHFPDLPIIAVSGVVQQHVLESAKTVGADEVLPKPITGEWKSTIERVQKAKAGRE